MPGGSKKGGGLKTKKSTFYLKSGNSPSPIKFFGVSQYAGMNPGAVSGMNPGAGFNPNIGRGLGRFGSSPSETYGASPSMLDESPSSLRIG